MHVRLDDLARYVTGDLPRGKLNSVREHLESGCRRCIDNLALLKKLRLANQLPALNRVPAELSLQVKKIHRPQRRSTSVGRILELAAELVYDSQLQPAPVGLRAVGTADRQMLFRLRDYDIDFRFSQLPSRPEFILSGQLLASSVEAVRPAEYSCHLQPARGKTRTARLNRLGEFQIDSIKPGQYELFLSAPGLRIVLTTIDLE